ncbi:hypothetical protein DMJ13_00600 [halophilic archaeon]|nr:hypothetical protein DMJ13_00600 [halophilic archaeon]
MSDFDKEAEREKLRQQYEEEQEDREATQRMSELLLQGATMTGKHCDTCGDPIFRYDGTEFCPTCQHETGQVETEETDSNAAGGATPGDAEPGEMEPNAAETGNADHEGEPSGSDQPAVGTEAGSGTPRPPETSRSRRAPSNQSGSPQSDESRERPGAAPADRTGTRTPPSQTGESPGRDGSARRGPSDRSERPNSGESVQPVRPAPDAGGDLDEARDALVRKLTRLAREAETTDDVARARDVLAATREAAEALAALDRANR